MDVLIVTRSKDVHAFAIADALVQRRLLPQIIEADGVSGAGGLTWSLSGSANLTDVAGNVTSVDEASVLWWRRLNGPTIIADNVSAEARHLVERDCRASLLGLLATEFVGRYVSDPEATRAAENKLVQLRAAQRAGCSLPDTLVSSDPQRVRDFCEAHGWAVIVKTVSGAGPRQPLMTGLLRPELVQDAAVRLTPAIYQEYVPGDRHLRVNVFGREVYAALLTTTRLDWRYPLDAVAEPYVIDATTREQLFAVLDELGLRMGVFDLKLTPNGQVVWLEVNPQGQFLWLEGLCGMPLCDAFADFLAAEVADVRNTLSTDQP